MQITVCDHCKKPVEPANRYQVQAITPCGSILHRWELCPGCYDDAEFLLKNPPGASESETIPFPKAPA
jgi:hypothetical protein